MTAATQVSAYISEETKAEIEAYVKRRGIKMGYLIEEALRHHLPTYPLPILRLARLAVDQRFQGRGLAGCYCGACSNSPWICAIVLAASGSSWMPDRKRSISILAWASGQCS